MAEHSPNALEHAPFNRIELHDGSSLTLKPELSDTYPGRFTATHPAAVEIHASMELLSGNISYLAITPDTESERLHQLIPQELKGTLALEDAGYFDKQYCHDIEQAGGYYVIRASAGIQPTIVQAQSVAGKVHKDSKLVGRKLSALNLQQGDLVDLNVTWKGYGQPFRLIAFWDKRKKRKGYLITNLSREQFGAQDIMALYSLRWQIDLS